MILKELLPLFTCTFFKNRYPEAKDKLALAEFIKTLANSTFGKFSGIMSHDGTELNPSKYWNAVWKISFPFFYNVSNSNVESYNQVT